MSTTAPDATPVKWWQRIAQIVVIGAVPGVFLATCLVSGSSSEAGSDGGQVQYSCKEWVKDRLVAPATADFSGVSTTYVDGQYRSVGRVDSSNALGVPIRSTYTCVATHTGDHSKLVSLNVS